MYGDDVRSTHLPLWLEPLSRAEGEPPSSTYQYYTLCTKEVKGWFDTKSETPHEGSYPLFVLAVLILPIISSFVKKNSEKSLKSYVLSSASLLQWLSVLVAR